MAAKRYKKIQMESSYSCATGEQSGKVLYTMDGRSHDWKGWHFEVIDQLLCVTPPNRYAVTEIPLVHVKFMVRDIDAEPATGDSPRPVGRPRTVAA